MWVVNCDIFFFFNVYVYVFLYGNFQLFDLINNLNKFFWILNVVVNVCLNMIVFFFDDLVLCQMVVSLLSCLVCFWCSLELCKYCCWIVGILCQRLELEGIMGFFCEQFEYRYVFVGIIFVKGGEFEYVFMESF